MKIRKGDQVKINSGKDRGKTGKVMKVFPKENLLLIEGLNLVFKHRKPRREGEKGQRVAVPSKMNVSRVMLVCPKCGQASRVGIKSGEKKMRVCKKCQAEF